MSRQNRILLLVGAAAIVASFAIAAIFAQTSVEGARLAADESAARSLQALGDELVAEVQEQREALAEYLLSADIRPLVRYRQAVTDEAAIAARLHAMASGLSGVSEALATIDSENDAWRAKIADPAISAVQTGSTTGVNVAIEALIEDLEVGQAATQFVVQIDVLDAALHVRSDELDALRVQAAALGAMLALVATCLTIWFARRYGRTLELDIQRADIFKRFTESTSMAADDRAVAAASLEALQLLARPDAAVVHVFNASRDRALPEAATGEARVDMLPLKTLATCPGAIRGSMQVMSDATIALGIRCPVYPVARGTLACIPMTDGGTIGTIHLHWERPNAFPVEMRTSVVRVAEHAALAIRNRRLLAMLEGQASSDARTGLANSRTFDAALENELSARGGDETLAVLLLDIDHFKDFNDRYGHPAGDEALRAFSGVLRACVRDGDLAARYGGEEFAVLLPGVDRLAAMDIAERIRKRTEGTVIELGPGISDRITVSIGVAMAPFHASDRMALLRIADVALYRAKNSGRNRVSFAVGGRGPDTVSRPGFGEAA